MGDHPAERTPLHYSDALHVHAKWTFAQILHAENIHLGKSDKALIDGGRVGNHEGSSLLALNTNRMAESPPFFRDEELTAPPQLDH